MRQARITRAKIKKIRQKLNLTQREASLIFGGGVNAFNRYEAGITKPGVSTINLLRLLDKHPESLTLLTKNIMKKNGRD